MKLKFSFLPIAAVTSVVILPMCAADKDERRDTWSGKQGGQVSEQWRSQQTERLGKVVKATEVIGTPVKNEQNEKLGTVEELAVDLETGRVVEVILASGGVLGVGEKHVAVPPRALTCNEADKSLRLNADKERLKNAPAIMLSRWDDLSDRNRISETYRYYGQEPYFSDSYHVRDGKSNPTDGREDSTHRAHRHSDAYTHERAEWPHLYRMSSRSFPTDRESDIAYRSPGEIPYDGTSQELWLNRNTGHFFGNKENFSYRADQAHSSDRADRSYQSDGANRAYQSTRDERSYQDAPPGHVARASKIIGMVVKNKNDEKVGKVDNLMVDLSNGRIVHVVLSAGGFLGIANELSAVPPSALDYDASEETLVIDANKEILTKGPHFRSSEWPNFNDTEYSGNVYRAYNSTPYFTTDADNTARNVRDRQGGSLTAIDQGNSKADIDLTRRIRQEILKNKQLSVNARNVKIITVNGRVTIRGPVNTDMEKRIISEIADRIAQRDNVDMQLEVKRAVSDN